MNFCHFRKCLARTNNKYTNLMDCFHRKWLLSLPLYRFIVLPTCTRCKSREHFTISKECPYKVDDNAKIPIDRDEYFELINFG